MINPQDFHALSEPLSIDGGAPKIANVLYFLTCGGTLNRFEAERKVHDHALNSTVSELANKSGIGILREWETVRGKDKKKTRCKRYSIDPAPGNLYRCYWLLRDVWGFTGRDIAPPSLPAPEVV